MDLGPASLTFRYGDSVDIANELEGYERLLHDTMLGTTRCSPAPTGWSDSGRSRHRCSKNRRMRQPYARGSWGPEAIDQLVAPHRWQLPYGEHR